MKGIPAGKNKGKNVSGYPGASNPTKVVAGNVASKGALPQSPMPGPTSSGQPSSMKKALAKKSQPSKGL
jgi:hypothetical protein